MPNNTRSQAFLLIIPFQGRKTPDRMTIVEWLRQVSLSQEKPVLHDDQAHMYQTEIPAKPF